MPEREPQREISHIERLLSESSVRTEIAYDMGQTNHLRHKEQWFLGVVESGQDLVILIPGEFDQGMRFFEKGEKLHRLPLKKTALLYPSIMFSKRDGLNVTGGGIKQIYPSWVYWLGDKPERGESMPISEITIAPGAFFRKGIPELQVSVADYPNGMPVPEFLRRQGFPLKKTYDNGDPLNLERGGFIEPNGYIHHPEYFVQRSLIDDEGNLIHLGLCESNPREDAVYFTPAKLEKLAKQGYRTGEVSLDGPRFLIRYHSFPYESDIPLSILDPPISAPDFAELVICPSGKARLYVAKDQPDSNWQQMMDRLRDLFIAEMRKKGNHLLRFTQDSAHLYEYLAQKEAILQDYFIIEDLGRYVS